MHITLQRRDACDLQAILPYSMANPSASSLPMQLLTNLEGLLWESFKNDSHCSSVACSMENVHLSAANAEPSAQCLMSAMHSTLDQASA